MVEEREEMEEMVELVGRIGSGERRKGEERQERKG